MLTLEKCGCPKCGHETVPRLLTVDQMASLLGVTAKRGYDLISLQIVPSDIVVRLGRQVRITESGLLHWIASGGSGL